MYLSRNAPATVVIMSYLPSSRYNNCTNICRDLGHKTNYEYIDQINSKEQALEQCGRKCTFRAYFVSKKLIQHDWSDMQIEKKKKASKSVSKGIFACPFSSHYTISLSRHEQACLLRLRFERYISHYLVT